MSNNESQKPAPGNVQASVSQRRRVSPQRQPAEDEDVVQEIEGGATGKFEDIGGVAIEQSPLINPATKIYDPERQRDWVRSITTYVFIGIFAVTIFGSMAIIIWDNTAWANAKEFLQIMLPAETALIGSVVGFYFGSQSRRNP